MGISTAPRSWRRIGTWPALPVAATGLSARAWWRIALPGVAVLALLSLWLRPLLPVDETRYVAVAWEMWRRGEFLVPWLNGEVYQHKPPLLFWLFHAGWAVTGVNETWPRLVGPASSLLALWALARLGERLWPARPGTGRLGSLMLLASTYFALYQTALMFDLPLLAFVALGWWQLVGAMQSGRWREWLGYGTAFGAALLLKGPVAAVYLLPPLLVWRAWTSPGAPPPGWRKPVAGLALGLALPGLWLLAAWSQGPDGYLPSLVGEQTLGRIQGELGHPRPLFWYLPFLLLLPLPWTLWPGSWRALRRLADDTGDPGTRFVLLTGVAGLLVLSLVHGKQVHYLIPLLALAMLGLARGVMAPVPGPGAVAAMPGGATRGDLLAMASPQAGDVAAVQSAGRWIRAGLAFAVLVALAGFVAVRADYDLAPAARHVAAQQQRGRDVLYVGNYQGEFGFLGRLRAPVAEQGPAHAGAWLRAHPDGLVVVRDKRFQASGHPRAEFVQRYRGGDLLMFRASDLLGTGSGFREPVADATR